MLKIAHFIVFFLCMHATPVGAETVYTFGVVPQFNARKMVRVWQPVIDEVQLQAGIKLRYVGAANIPAFEEALGRGDYDFAYVNPYHALLANQQQGYQPIIKDVANKLYGILVVKKDSPVQKVEELDGHQVAFPAPNALGASLMMRAELDGQFHIKILPMYVNSHTSVYMNVIAGQAQAGGGVQKTFNSLDENVRNQLRVLYHTEKVSPHPIVVHPRVEQAVIASFQKAFVELGSTDKGKALFDNIPIKQAGVATIKDYDALKKMGLEKYHVK